MTAHVPYDFNIDHYLNRFIPRNRIDRLPKPISRFLGHREDGEKPLGSVLVWFWSCIGAICGILVVEAVYRTPVLRGQGAPIIIGSFGASAILKYHTVDSPLAQPRNAIVGQFLSSIIGVSISKLFLLSSNYHNVRIVGGALAVGISSVVMGFTKTVHPPAGATALLAVVSDEVTELGWLLVPLIVLGAALMCVVACILNNIQRTYPVYWWSPADVGQIYDNQKNDGATSDVEKASEDDMDGIERSGRELIVVRGDKVILPVWMSLGVEERAILEMLRTRLQHELRVTSSRASETTFVTEHEPHRDLRQPQ